MAVAHIGHVHGLGIGRALVIRHALVGFVGETVLHLQQRAVREHDVIAVAGIVVGELPVALVFEPVGLADRDLALGLAVEPFVDRLGDGAEIIEQRRRIGIERREDEAAIAVDARHLRDVEFRVLEIAGIAVGPRHRAQLAGVEIAPAVIGAGEDARRALLLAAERGAAVGAAVEQRADFALRVAQQDDRAQAEPRGDEVVVLGDLALVAEIDPDRAEDVGHLGREDRRVGVDQAMDAVLLDQLVPVVEIGRARDRAGRSRQFFQHAPVPSSQPRHHLSGRPRLRGDDTEQLARPCSGSRIHSPPQQPRKNRNTRSAPTRSFPHPGRLRRCPRASAQSGRPRCA